MKLQKLLFVFLFVFFSASNLFSQLADPIARFNDPNQKSFSMSFQFINNMIVIPVKINNRAVITKKTV